MEIYERRRQGSCLRLYSPLRDSGYCRRKPWKRGRKPNTEMENFPCKASVVCLSPFTEMVACILPEIVLPAISSEICEFGNHTKFCKYLHCGGRTFLEFCWSWFLLAGDGCQMSFCFPSGTNNVLQSDGEERNKILNQRKSREELNKKKELVNSRCHRGC